MVKSEAGDLTWDTNDVQSNASSVQCQGHLLERDTLYAVTVSTTIRCGDSMRPSSLTVPLSAGLTTAEDWDGAQWIAGSPDVSHTARNMIRSPNWSLPASPSSASVFVAGLGHHELWCNGAKQGHPDAKLQPGFTNYEKRALYIRYNLTSCLTGGTNTLAVVLGNDWFSAQVLAASGQPTDPPDGSAPRNWPPYQSSY